MDVTASRTRVPPNLPALVKAAFARALDGGDLIYYPTHVAVLNVGSTPFQLRFSPSLAAKPKAPPKPPPTQDGGTPSREEVKKKPFNPFESPHPALLVSDDLVPNSHRIVLNKFAIVREHFLVVTRDVRPQTHVLESADLAATMSCIAAYHYRQSGDEEGQGDGLFAFFNSGAHSGASQPHRHLQLLPVREMRGGLEAVDRGGEWEGPLVDRLLAPHAPSSKSPAAGTAAARLPFAVFAAPVTPDMDPALLHETYLGLYRRAVRACGAAGKPGLDGEAIDAEADVPVTGEAKISYNLGITSTTMALCPRMAEGGRIKLPGKGKAEGEEEQFGTLSLNGTVLAGTALVKSEAEWDAVRRDPELLTRVLAKIGLPPSAAAAAAGEKGAAVEHL